MKNKIKLSISDRIFTIAVYIICAFVFLIIAYPLFFIIISSISNPLLVSEGKVLLIPKGVSLFGFQKIFEDARIWIGYRNTIFYTIVGTMFNICLTLPAAYVLSRKDFRGRKIIMFLFIFTMFFNGGLIPTYLLIQKLHIDNTILVFILPFAVNAFNLIICRTFFENSISKELYEAASIDGCGDFNFFVKIAMPLSKAITAVITLYYMVGHWNDFFTGLIYIRNDKLVPLQLVLRDILVMNNVFASGTGGFGSYDQIYANTVKYGIIIVSSLPVLIFYPFIQKYFEKGIMLGAVKG